MTEFDDSMTLGEARALLRTLVEDGHKCPCCVLWEHNLRAIGLGLEALRAVDRHGITRRGEQYAGFKVLTSGGPSRERGEALIREHGSERAALMATHPDHGGDAGDFADVQATRS